MAKNPMPRRGPATNLRPAGIHVQKPRRNPQEQWWLEMEDEEDIGVSTVPDGNEEVE